MNIQHKKKIITTDLESGEQKEETKEYLVNYGKTADFVMTFTKDLGYMKDLTKGEMLLMFGLLKIVNDQNQIILNSSIKKMISKEFDLKINSIDSLLTSLVKKNMIKRIDRGVYLLNTFLFGKGKWSEIKKQRMFIEWDFEKLTKKVMVEQDYMSEEELIQKQIKQLEEQQKMLEEKRKEEEQQNPNLFTNMENDND